MILAVRITIIVAGCALALFTAAAGAQTTNADTGPDFSAFKRILDNNIFNTKRSARYVPTERRNTARSKSESFALVGTMNYHEKGALAFFEGSSPDYKKVLKPEDSIAGFKVEAIEPSAVKLASPTNEIELHVGMELRREEQGAWKLGQRPEVIEPRSSTSSSRPSTPTASTRAPDSSTSPTPAAPDDFSQFARFLPPGALDAIDRAAGILQTNSAPNTAAPNTASPNTASPTGNEADILETLRRRREQENQ